jgi:glycosyltransferase involved in cell wall biosynthesis
MITKKPFANMSIDTSVIICNYNNEAYIGRAIRSCLKQSIDRERYEIIVVDDGSTDNSVDVIKSFGDQVKLITQENRGVAEASNVGIRAAQGSFVIRVDSDDYIKENALLFLTEVLLTNPDIGFVYADHIRVDKHEKPLGRVVINTLDLLFRHGAGIMMRKSYLEAIGLYDKNFRNAEDFDLLKRYIKNYDGYHLKLPLYNYRQHDTNMTRNVEERKVWDGLVIAKHHDHQDWE